jgi:hypothetical protein
MLTDNELTEMTAFLNRLQGQTVRFEFASRLNIGFRMSFAVKLSKVGEEYQLASESNEVNMFIDPSQAEGFSSDHTSVSLVFGDNMVTIRYARTR